MLVAMRSVWPPSTACFAFGLGLAVLSAGPGCKTSPTEAPEPDAAQWGTPAPPPAEPEVEDEPAEAWADRSRPPGTIFRDEIDRAIGPGPAYLLRQLGPEPYRHDGHFVGWQITQRFPDDPSLCAPCDLELGDVILSVNGRTLSTPQQLSDALKALPTWTELKVASLRQGKRRVVTYPIVDDTVAPG